MTELQNTLQALEQLGRMIALREMKSKGTVQPTLLIANEQAVIEFACSSFPDAGAKDKLAQIARLLAITNSAVAVTTVFESWVRLADRPGGAMGQTFEAVSLVTEAAGTVRTSILAIERTSKGKFRRLRHREMPNPDSAQGRFASLLPPRTPTEEDKRHARQLLALMGIAADGNLIHPHLN